MSEVGGKFLDKNNNDIPDDLESLDGNFRDFERLGDYKIVEVLNENPAVATFVVESTKNPGNFFSMNCMDLTNTSEMEKNIFLSNARVLASINHPLILKYHEIFVEEDEEVLW